MSKELTEKWKQGKLESDAYYTKIKDPLCPAFVCVNEYFKDDECPEFRDFPDEWIIEVLDKVPSYEEYQALLSDSLAKNEGVEIIAELENRIEELEQQNAYECECNKEYSQTLKDNEELKAKIHILTESQMNLENTIGSQADFFRQKISVLESQLSSISEQLKDANEIIRFYCNTDQLIDEEKQMSAEKYHLVYGLKANDYLEKYGVEK